MYLNIYSSSFGNIKKMNKKNPEIEIPGKIHSVYNYKTVKKLNTSVNTNVQINMELHNFNI